MTRASDRNKRDAGWHLGPWALALLGLALGQAVLAQDKSTRSALIIGVSTYASPDVSTLTGVPADIPLAEDMARAMGIPAERTRVLRDGAATKAAVLEALDQLSSEVAEGGRVFVYFSGHGTRWYDGQTKGCKEGLLAHDGQAITNDEIAQHTRRIHGVADKLIVVFDACHSGGVGQRDRFTRSAVRGALTPKFFSRSEADAQACEQPANLRTTRSLLAATGQLGGLSENFVQVTSARPDEVSFDEPGKGGLATQGLHACLLGGAVDSNGSGSVSVAEIERCTQAAIDAKLKPWPQLIPHHVTVSGNRNLVPVPVKPTPVPVAGTTTPLVAPDPPVVAPALASLATLEDIASQRNPRRKLQVVPSRKQLRIGQDALGLSVTSSHDGYLYMVLLGSDQRSFYLLFPNGLDANNLIRANTRLDLPRPEWAVKAQGPAGTNRLLVLVTDTPRDLGALAASPPDAAAPFTFALNDLPGRAALMDFFTGRGVTGQSESFGAQLLAVQEVP
ncbi:MAG TPA: caspase family protein [Burkholderiaceae bacterium]|nr:caspase family protein [Burkholderiaceae bacterium]